MAEPYSQTQLKEVEGEAEEAGETGKENKIELRSEFDSWGKYCREEEREKKGQNKVNEGGRTCRREMSRISDNLLERERDRDRVNLVMNRRGNGGREASLLICLLQDEIDSL